MIKKLEEKVNRIDRQGGGGRKVGGVKGKAEYIDIGDDSEDSKTIQSLLVPGSALQGIARPAAEALNPP